MRLLRSGSRGEAELNKEGAVGAVYFWVGSVPSSRNAACVEAAVAMCATCVLFVTLFGVCGRISINISGI